MSRRVWNIDSTQIEEEFIRLPGDLASLSELHVEAAESAEYADLALEILEARATAEIREHAKLMGDNATVNFLSSKLKLRPDWQSAKRESIARRAEEARAKAMVNAVIAKREMLISLGAHIRAQLMGDPTTRAKGSISRSSRKGSFEDHDWSSDTNHHDGSRDDDEPT